MKYIFLLSITVLGTAVGQDQATKLLKHVQEGTLGKEKLEQMLNRGLNLMTQGDQALLQAVLNRDTKTVGLLQNYGALPGDNSIALAVLLDNQESLKIIVDQGLTPWARKNFDQDFVYCLVQYAHKKNLKVAKTVENFAEQLAALQGLTPGTPI